MKTSKMIEAAANKLLLGLEADEYTVQVAPSGRPFSVAQYNDPDVWITDFKVVGITNKGDTIEADLISQYRGAQSLESELAKIKQEFFKPVDDFNKEEENESN